MALVDASQNKLVTQKPLGYGAPVTPTTTTTTSDNPTQQSYGPAFSAYTPGIPQMDPVLLANAADAYNRALASVNSRRATSLTSYGFKAGGFDASGNPINLQVDPNSMYGKYQQMLDSQARASMAAANSGAGRGFSGGLANQAESSLRYGQGAQSTQLGNSLLGEFNTEEQDSLNATSDYNSQLVQIALAAAQAAAANGYWTEVPDMTDSEIVDPSTNAGATDMSNAVVRPAAKPAAAKKNTPAKAQVLAKKVTANKTGATVVKGRGVISIH